MLGGLTTKPYEGSSTAAAPVPAAGWDRMVVFVGKFADWKRVDTVLMAAKKYAAAAEIVGDHGGLAASRRG